VLDFAKQVGSTSPHVSQCTHFFVPLRQRGWQIDLTEGMVRFAQKGEEKLEIGKEKLISNNLAYARELEQIV
jgi:hypothetical protein